VLNIAAESVLALVALSSQIMHLQCTIQDGVLWLGNGEVTVEVVPEVWLGRRV